MSNRLHGQVAIVTGGSSGMGRATCLALAQAGAHVVIVGRDRARLDNTAAQIAELASGGVRALPLALDVRSEADMQQMAARTLAEFGHIDILVCSAGVLRAPGAGPRPIWQTEFDNWKYVLDINARGMWLANRAVLPTMLAQERGDIVNVSSQVTELGFGFDAAYPASKCAGNAMTEALATEVAPDGVRVHLLTPGLFDTEMMQQRWNTNLLSPGVFPPPSRVADMVLYLVGLPDDTRLVNPLVHAVNSDVSSAWQGKKTSAAAQPAGSVSDFLFKTQEAVMAELHGGRTARMRGQVVIVTGGTGGIGLATCRAAAAENASVVVVDINQERVDSATGDLANYGQPEQGHLGIALDVRDEAAVQAMTEAVLARYGRIDALVCAAGILRKRGTPPKPLLEVSLEEWNEVLDVNLNGVFLMNRAVLPTMIKQRSGIIVNISSVSGLKGRAHDGPYCASKFGVIGLSQSVADEVRTYGVKVQTVLPDSIDTPFWEQNYPVPRPGNSLPPERVADLIVFMMTQAPDTVLANPIVAPLGARRRKSAGAAKPSADAPTSQE